MRHTNFRVVEQGDAGVQLRELVRLLDECATAAEGCAAALDVGERDVTGDVFDLAVLVAHMAAKLRNLHAAMTGVPAEICAAGYPLATEQHPPDAIACVHLRRDG